MTGMICLLLFAAFVFLYLLLFQGDLLFYAQHVLSKGVTVYEPTVGAVIITGLLLLLAFYVVRPLANHLYYVPAMYYFPSALILAALTDINIVKSQDESVFGHGWIIAVVLMVVFIFVVQLMKRAVVAVRLVTPKDVLVNLCLNITVMIGIFFCVMIVANTDEKDHSELEAERYLLKKDYAKAAEVGKVQNCDTEEMTMIRAYALANMGQLGEHFFEYVEYPAPGNSAMLLPSKDNHMKVFPEMKIYRFIGGVPSEGMSARECLRLLEKRGKLREKAKDYLLTACLIDCDLDAFADYLRQDYDSTMVLPKHYREALTLHNHLRANPVLEYELPEMEANFVDFQEMIKNNPDKVLCENTLRDYYGETYWFYYYFTARKAFIQSVSREN